MVVDYSSDFSCSDFRSICGDCESQSGDAFVGDNSRVGDRLTLIGSDGVLGGKCDWLGGVTVGLGVLSTHHPVYCGKNQLLRVIDRPVGRSGEGSVGFCGYDGFE